MIAVFFDIHNMNTGKDVVERIDTLLKQKKQKRQALADYAGISIQAFTNWSSRGNFPPSDVLYKISQYFGVSMEYLVTGFETDTATKELAELKRKLIELGQS